MIKNLKDEIKVRNKSDISNYNNLHTQDFHMEIGNEKIKMKKSRELDLVDKFDVAHISQLVTLQKKDVKMKKLIVVVVVFFGIILVNLVTGWVGPVCLLYRVKCPSPR